MNRYKKANLWDDINKYGPNSPVTSIDDPRVQFIADSHNISKEQALEYFGKKHTDVIQEYYKRDYFTKNYGWSIPDKKSLQKVKRFIGSDQVLEIGSGYGLWAKLMKDMGINVIATDALSDPEQKKYRPLDKTFTEIENLTHSDAINKYGSANVLMLSWPPYLCSMAAQSIKNFKGNKLIFIGEGSGGCTADDDFFKELDNNWQEVEQIKEFLAKRWVGIYDTLTLWKRKMPWGIK